MTPRIRPKVRTESQAALDLPRTEGRERARRTSAERTRRSMTAPPGPTRSKRRTAIPAPNCTEAMLPRRSTWGGIRRMGPILPTGRYAAHPSSTDGAIGRVRQLTIARDVDGGGASGRAEAVQALDGLAQDLVLLAEREPDEGPRSIGVVVEDRHRDADDPGPSRQLAAERQRVGRPERSRVGDDEVRPARYRHGEPGVAQPSDEEVTLGLQGVGQTGIHRVVQP